MLEDQRKHVCGQVLAYVLPAFGSGSFFTYFAMHLMIDQLAVLLVYHR